MPTLIFLLSIFSFLPSPNLGNPGKGTTLSADRGTWTGADNSVTAEGNVTLSSGDLLLRANNLEYHFDDYRGAVRGDVLFFDGNLVLIAEEGRFGLLQEGQLSLKGVELLQKKEINSSEKENAKTPADARLMGQNELVLYAEVLEKIGKSRFLAQKLRLTACNTNNNSADWSIMASSADIQPEERAILWWPTFYVKRVPVLILPVLYFPLSSRRTGLLFPQMKSLSDGVFLLDQPMFVTLGLSHDLTFVLGYRFRLKPLSDNSRATGTKGWASSLEWRYAPWEHTVGSVKLSGVYDQNPSTATSALTEKTSRGFRGILELEHDTDLSNGFSLHSRIKGVSDTKYLEDEGLSSPQYLRSQSWVGWRNRNLSFSLSSSWYQDLSDKNSEIKFLGRHSPVFFQRPVSFLVHAPRKKIGPLHLGMELAGTHYQPLSWGEAPTTNMATLSRIHAYPSLGFSLLDSKQRLYIDAHVKVRAAIDSYSSHEWNQTVGHARAIGGLRLGTELSRDFGTTRHLIEPEIEFQAASRPLGAKLDHVEGIIIPGDEYDFGDSLSLQAKAKIANHLYRHGKLLASLQIAQGADISQGKLGDCSSKLQLFGTHVTLTGEAFYDWNRRQMSQINTELLLKDNRGDQVKIGYKRLLEEGSEPMRSTIDEILGRTAFSQGFFDEVSINLSVSMAPWILLTYETKANPNRKGDSPFFLSHTGTIQLGSCQECWNVKLSVNQAIGISHPTVRFGFELKNLFGFTQ